MIRIIASFALAAVILLPDLPSAYQTVDVVDGASLTGKVVFKGKAPEPEKILINKNKEVCGTGYRKKGEVRVSASGGLMDVVVYLEGIKKGKPLSKPAGGYVLDQKNCSFLPYVQVIPRRSKLVVLNSDPVLHNVHTYELIGRVKRTMFNFAQPVQGSKITKTIRPRRGKVVKIECDAHNWMLGWIYVLDHPYFSVVGEDGTFKIDGIPPGTYKVKAWHPILGIKEGKASVSAKGTARLSFEFAK
ncbi:MAG: hypothetical protein V3S39_00455 [Thermodesulfobacteriota bacterium]